MANNYFKFKQFTIKQDKCSFKVGTDGVLLGAYARTEGKSKILDIGTGSGLIALMLAQRCDADIFSIEPDYDSFVQAKENVASSRWSDRIKVENCLLQNYTPGNLRFDLIITNPPFFINSLKNPDLAKSAARHNDTLTHQDLLSGTDRLLAEDGILQLIMPYAEGSMFIAEAREFGLMCNDILKVRPLPTAGIRRVILSFSRIRTKTTERFLTIEKGRRYEFTDEYITLTKDFYLKF